MLPGPNRFGWLTFGLMLFATACSPFLVGPQAATDGGELPTATQVARTKVTATPDIAEPVDSVLPERTPAPTPTASLLTVAPEVEDDLTETPAPNLEADGEPEPTEEQLRLLAGLQSYGPAPELHNEVWLNSGPLQLAELRGQVVMVEFWTFG